MEKKTASQDRQHAVLLKSPANIRKSKGLPGNEES